MPGATLVHVGAQLMCPHGGQVTGVASSPRVTAGKMPVLTASDTFTVAACPFQIPVPPGTKPQPCVTVKWIVPSLRVKVGGKPALVRSSVGLCQSAEQIPQGPPNVVNTQMRASGQ